MAKILIVDDEKDLCLVLNRFLSKHGFQVIEANKGKKALELLSEGAPDLILCDFKLDDMDGTSVLKAIKEVNPSIPVIIITGYSNIKTAVEVMRLGAFDYVTKPLIPDEILMTIRRALDKSNTPSDAAQTGDSRIDTEHRGNNGKRMQPNKPDNYIFGDCPYFKNILK